MSNWQKGVFGEVEVELLRAERLHGTFNSLHEGYAVILEELDEVWDTVKRNNYVDARAEAIQVAAMAIRFVFTIDSLTVEPQAQQAMEEE